MLLGKEVTCVLTGDSAGRLVSGALVRNSSKGEELKSFLEWAIGVQEDLTKSWGEPTRVHQLNGVNDLAGVVEKIQSGRDYYEVAWEPAGHVLHVVFRIRAINDRTVGFRLEYRRTGTPVVQQPAGSVAP